MAKTYYGYKKRDGLQAIDYLGAAKDLTEGLTGIFEEREKERGLIEEEIRKAEEEAKDVPMGDSSTLNEMVLDSSNGAAEALRVQAQLMRNGVIRPSEYTKFKQNTLDGVKDLKEGAVSLNKNITDAKAAVDNETASVATMTFLDDAMKNTWFDRTRMYTDPKTGHLMIVRTDEKGKDIDGSETTMRNFKNQTKQVINRYDVEKETSSFTKTLGEDVRLALKDPNIKTIKDALQKKTIDPVSGKEYTNFQLIDQWVESITDADAASILVDELGGKYSATGDVNEKGKVGKVYYKIDPTAANKNTRTADLTPEQRKAAKEYLKRNIYAQLDYVETPAPTTSGKASSSAQIAKGRRVDIDKERINDWLKFYTGDDATKERILSANSETIAKSVGAGNRPIDINVVGDTISVSYEKEYENGTTETITKPITIPEDDFVGFLSTSGRKLLGDDFIEYLDEALEISDYTGTEKYKPLDVSYKTQVDVEESKKQELGDFAKIMNPVLPMKSYFFDSTRDRNVESRIGSYQSNSGIKGFDFSVEDGVVNMSIEGLGAIDPISVVGMDAVDIQPLIDKALIKVHEAATTGKPLEGTTETADSAGDNVITVEDLPD